MEIFFKYNLKSLRCRFCTVIIFCKYGNVFWWNVFKFIILQIKSYSLVSTFADDLQLFQMTRCLQVIQVPCDEGLS